MNQPIRIVGFSGSLRTGSYNTAALKVAQSLAPEGVSIDIVDISQLPLYNNDADRDGPPEAVKTFLAQVANADGFLFVTPEYNYSVSAPLKNAIDWASRGRPQPFNDKAAAIMGASMGALGTARAQYHLRQIGVFLNLHFVNKPEVMIGAAHTKFDAEGNLTDETTRTFIQQLVESLVKLARRLKASA